MHAIFLGMRSIPIYYISSLFNFKMNIGSFIRKPNSTYISHGTSLVSQTINSLWVGFRAKKLPFTLA